MFILTEDLRFYRTDRKNILTKSCAHKKFAVMGFGLTYDKACLDLFNRLKRYKDCIIYSNHFREG